jgi:NAD(P)-dependent dehydrogenase (short-subunit alcohol dehydrogenase family)
MVSSARLSSSDSATEESRATSTERIRVRPCSSCPSKMRVNVVSPGPVTTPGSREFSEALGAPHDFFAKEIPLGRYGSPEDLAEVVALLASDRGK